MVRLRTYRLALLMTSMTAIAAVTLQAQAGRSSVCKDGTISNVSGRGACTSHGGVDPLATKAARERARVADAARGAERKTKREVAEGEVKMRQAEERERETAKSEKRELDGRRRAEDRDPAGAIAMCKDGMYSHAASRRGACSRHGGVSKWVR